MSSASAPGLAAALNQRCECITIDDQQLDQALRREAGGLGLEQLIASHPHLFSRCAVFIDPETTAAMQALVAAVERVITLPAYAAHVLADAHPHARIATPCRGAFIGFDFHLGAGGPQLIEINTNAGGGLLNTVLRRAQRACCAPVATAFGVGAPSEDFFAMFLDEWRLARGDRPLRTVAIVDDAPEQQYLYPEFLLFRALCAAHGVEAMICDARSLEVTGDGVLRHAGTSLDLVYNRLTDFPLELPEHAALAEAFRGDLAVVTPHPRAYALYADKRRLALLSDPPALRVLGVPEPDIELITRHVPRTRIVHPELRDELWRDRKHLFFKPQHGYGGKAAYRGDSITHRVFERVLREPYVAQDLVPPSVRTLRVGDETRELKLDIRNFTYAGRTQLRCARLYHGQTTNFRSEGGGFAPVYVI